MKEIFKWNGKKFFLQEPYDGSWFGDNFDQFFNIGILRYLSEDKSEILVEIDILNADGLDFANLILDKKNFTNSFVQKGKIYFYFDSSRVFRELIEKNYFGD